MSEIVAYFRLGASIAEDGYFGRKSRKRGTGCGVLGMETGAKLRKHPERPTP